MEFKTSRALEWDYNAVFYAGYCFAYKRKAYIKIYK